jgi:hypothetical protein
VLEVQDRILSMEVRQTSVRQGVDTFVVSAESVNGVPKSHQFFINQTDKVEFYKALAAGLGLEITYKPHVTHAMEPVIEQHPTFNTPADDQVIWRYMSFSKFMSLISSGSLWFSRADILQASDPMEGRVPDAQVEVNNAHLRKMKLAPVTDGLGNEVFSSAQRSEHEVVMHARRDYFQRYHTYINCWHLCDVENFAMWRIYGEDKNCIAVKSTVGDLRKALGESDNYKIFAGTIDYVDYSNPEIGKKFIPNGFKKYLSKSIHYKYEQELRLIFSDDGAVSDLIPNEVKYHKEPIGNDIKDLPVGVKVPVDVNQLVNEVVLGPDCEPWFIEMMQELTERENSQGLMLRLGKLQIKTSNVKGYQIPSPPDINW